MLQKLVYLDYMRYRHIMIYCKNELEFVQHDRGCRVLVTPCQVHGCAMDSPDVVKNRQLPGRGTPTGRTVRSSDAERHAIQVSLMAQERRGQQVAKLPARKIKLISINIVLSIHIYVHVSVRQECKRSCLSESCTHFERTSARNQAHDII